MLSIDKKAALPILEDMLKKMEELFTVTRRTGQASNPDDELFVQNGFVIKEGLTRLRDKCKE